MHIMHKQWTVDWVWENCVRHSSSVLPANENARSDGALVAGTKSMVWAIVDSFSQTTAFRFQ